MRGGQSGRWLLRDLEPPSVPALSRASLHHTGSASHSSPSHLPGALPALPKGGLWFGMCHPLPVPGSLLLLYQPPPPGSAVHTSALPHRQGGSRPVIRVSPQSAFPERPGSPPPMSQRPGHQSQACPCDHVIVLGESLVQFKGKV